MSAPSSSSGGQMKQDTPPGAPPGEKIPEEIGSDISKQNLELNAQPKENIETNSEIVNVKSEFKANNLNQINEPNPNNGSLMKKTEEKLKEEIKTEAILEDNKPEAKPEQIKPEEKQDKEVKNDGVPNEEGKPNDQLNINARVKPGEVADKKESKSEMNGNEVEKSGEVLEVHEKMPCSTETDGNKMDSEPAKEVTQLTSEVAKIQELESINSTANTNTKEVETKEGRNDGLKETVDEAVPKEPSSNETSQAEGDKEPQPPNSEKKDEEENKPEEECLNIQELTEHVMNIINTGVATEKSNRSELLKKNQELQQFIVKLIHLLKEKTDLCANLDRQNSALISQAKSLKDVISITKDLLGIRNMEVEHLRADLDAMEECIKAERNRHNTAVQHLTEAMGLNDKLKTEYLTQMDLFEKLKEKYTEKVVVLTRENIRMNALLQQNGIDPSVTVNESSETTASNSDANQTESVDK